MTDGAFLHLEQLQTSMVGPWQFLPPHRGAGLSQDLERHKQELTPSAPPSSLLQGCQGDHGPKPPLAVWFRSWEPDGGGVKIRSPGGVAVKAVIGARYRADGDVLLPLAHVGAVLQGGASMLPEVPATVGVPGLQAHPAGGGEGRGGGSFVSNLRAMNM